MADLSQNEQQKIKKIISKAASTSEKTQSKVEKPLPHTELQGYLKGSKYAELDRRIWFYLQRGQYDSFYKLTTRMCQRSDVPEYLECSLNHAVVYIHNDKDHEKCISSLCHSLY